MIDQHPLIVNGLASIKKLDTVTFLHADCMDYLRWCKEEMMWKHFHVGIVDPPYGVSITSQNRGSTIESLAKNPRNYESGEWDNEIPTQEYWDLMNYCCRNLIIWGGNYFVSNLGPADIKNGRCFIVWDKMNDKLSFAHGELALTTFDKNAVIIRRTRQATSAEDDGERRHPTQKPVYLYDFLHLNFVERGQRVLDTHGGSFNHAIAAYKNNVNLTIIDKQKSYVDSGIAAYEAQSRKGRLLF